MVKEKKNVEIFFEVKYEGRITWKFKYSSDESGKNESLQILQYFPRTDAIFKDSITRKEEDIIILGIEEVGKSNVLEDLCSSYKKQRGVFSKKFSPKALELLLSAIDYCELRAEGKPCERYCV